MDSSKNFKHCGRCCNHGHHNVYFNTRTYVLLCISIFITENYSFKIMSYDTFQGNWRLNFWKLKFIQMNWFPFSKFLICKILFHLQDIPLYVMKILHCSKLLNFITFAMNYTRPFTCSFVAIHMQFRCLGWDRCSSVYRTFIEEWLSESMRGGIPNWGFNAITSYFCANKADAYSEMEMLLFPIGHNLTTLYYDGERKKRDRRNKF